MTSLILTSLKVPVGIDGFSDTPYEDFSYFL